MRHFLFVALLFSIKSFACTDFLLMDQNKQYVVGRSMEFGLDLQSNIIVSPRGREIQSMINGQKGMTWKQNYAFIGLTALGQEQLIVDGVNEKGLSFGVLWMPDSKYPENNLSDMSHTLSLIDVGAWLLGTFATVAEVKQALSTVQIFFEPIAALRQVPPVHLSLHDRSGHSLVVECIDGKMEIHDNPLGILTNAPKFDWQITNLRNYINLSSKNVGPITFDGLTLTPTGQGTGMLGLPGDWTPPSRFVKIAVLLATATKAATTNSNVNLAFHLLNSVDIPYGVIQPASDEKPDYTQWIIVKDLQNSILYYRTYDNLNIKTVNLNQAVKKGYQRIKL